MATQTSVATGKSSATGTWSNAKKPEVGSDIVIAGGFAVEWNTTGTRIRSIEVQTGCTLSGTAALVLGAASAGNNGTSENILLKFASGATVTWKGNVEISCTFTTTPQTVGIGGKTGAVEKLAVESTNTAKVQFSEAFTHASTSVCFVEGGTLELNALTHSFRALELRTGGTISGAGATIRKTASGELLLAAGTITGGSTLTIEIEGAENEGLTTSLNGKTIGTLAIKVKNHTLDPGAEGCTVGNLTVNNKGAVATKGLKITKERKVTVTGTLSCDGTEAERARIESTEAGKAAKLKVVEQEVSGLALQDIAVETGVLYIVKGSNVSGNSEVGTTVKFEAKPAAPATAVLGMIV